jgi:hypothetical protein
LSLFGSRKTGCESTAKRKDHHDQHHETAELN